MGNPNICKVEQDGGVLTVKFNRNPIREYKDELTMLGFDYVGAPDYEWRAGYTDVRWIDATTIADRNNAYWAQRQAAEAREEIKAMGPEPKPKKPEPKPSNGNKNPGSHPSGLTIEFVTKLLEAVATRAADEAVRKFVAQL